MNNIKATNKENKIIYVYHHPESKEHLGWLKIGDQTGFNSGRIKDQNEADNIKAETLYMTEAVDKNGNPFRDFEVHAIIDATAKYEREKKKNSKSGRFAEWYKMTKNEAISFIEARKNLNFRPDVLKKDIKIIPRDEQRNAIDQTYEYWENAPRGRREFLWNAKPRFGKTLTSYWFTEKIQAKKVLIVTNRPAISDSWYTDYKDFIQPKGIYGFGSTKNNRHINSSGNLQGRALNIEEAKESILEGKPIIFFISLQDIKGKDLENSESFKKKNQWIFNESWDLFIIDESHEATETDKAHNLFKNLKTNFTLHLSGTPFKALTTKKFNTNQIFNWTYEDEQSAKENWDPVDGENPYYELPRMNMFAYRLSKTLSNTVEEGEYAFDLNELFKTSQGKFIYEDKVLKFLDNLFGINSRNNQNTRPFPFADTEIRDELKHTFWLLPGVPAVKALKKLMQEHGENTPSRKIFSDYKIIDASAKGDDEHEGKTALEKVKNIIDDNTKAIKTKTITLSCGQLTTGVTVRPWTAVLMLYGAEGGKTSATKYLQAAFRAQNPWRYKDGNGNDMLKENCYVFDFAPDRLLLIFQDYAKSVIGGGDGAREKVKKLLNFLTVVAEDEYGEMKELDANEVVTMPLKLMTQEIVDGKFITSNKLFNIGNVFHLPQSARDILNEMGTIKKGRIEHDKSKNIITKPELEYDNDGNLILNESNLGKKKYEELLQDNPDLPTDRVPTINDLSPSDAKTKIEKQIEKEESEQEDAIHDHLRYFARAIPMILMAYGKPDTRLDSFEKYIDSSTFKELVGITKEQFQELRDKHKLFNEEVFNSSIKEFLNRKAELADYYENDSNLDIFDYIPPQQTNQIYTPKSVVKMMVDDLEKQNPKIFKSKENTFLDPYMKSGLFITEIIKRLYSNLEKQIPNKHKRLEHILTTQVYGFAPTKILHLISNETIFGFMRGRPEFKKNRYRVEKNFVYFENEDTLVVKNQNELYNKVMKEFGKNMKFTAVIGNPPYQEIVGKSDTQTQGNSNWIYHHFQNSADIIGNYTCLIYPFGGWFDSPERLGGFGKKILSDCHTLSIQAYEGTSDKRAWYRNDKEPEPIFGSGANLSAGVSVVLRDNTKEYVSFVYSNRMYSDKKVIVDFKNWQSLAPNPTFVQWGKLSNGPKLKRRIKKGIFDIESNFVEKNKSKVSFKESDWKNPIKLLTNDKSGSAGRAKMYWTDRSIIGKGQQYIDKYKVVVTSAYPKKTFVSGKPTIEHVKVRAKELIEILPKGSAFGRSKLCLFMSENDRDCKNFIKYTQTNLFAFLLLQEPNRRSTFGDVILDQDFSDKSDIDWSKSIPEINRQLYTKYGMTKKEIDFIETGTEKMK